MIREYRERTAADRRLAILEILSSAGAPANPVVLRGAIEDVTLHRPSMDQVRADVRWLAERGLVLEDAAGAALAEVTITERGEDVAGGRTRVLGVAVPRSAGDRPA